MELAYLHSLVASKAPAASKTPLEQPLVAEELAAAELEVHELLKPLAKAAVASLDQAGGEAALGTELEAARQAGQRLLRQIQRAREALEPPRELGGMSCSP